jgi:hypothetical protein
MKKFISKQLGKIGKHLSPPSRPQDLSAELQRMATRSSAEYIAKSMRNVLSVDNIYSFHDFAISKATIQNGLALEFGVFAGKTINHIASRRDWTVHGFDSFEGLPEFWRDGFGKGAFKLDNLPTVRDNVRLHKGWFDESIPKFMDTLADRRTPIAYLHVDCDLYSSTKTIFELLGDNIIAGTVIAFDEYFNYDGWEEGEFLAFQEFKQAKGFEYEYLTYNSKHEQVAVVIK